MAGWDLHTHLAPEMDPGLELPGIERVDGRLVVDGSLVGPADLYRPDRLEDFLDSTGLDSAVVAIPPPFFRQHLAATASAEWVLAANDGITSATQGASRLVPLAYLPLEHPHVAIAEYERVRQDSTFAGVTSAAGGRSVSLADPVLEPLWQMLDADERMLLLHPGEASDPRLADFYLANLLGNPVETGVATAQLVFGDVLARFSGMRVLLVHCGGVVPSVLGRWQRGVDTERPGIRALKEAPTTAVRRIFFDCLAHDPATVDHAVTTFGEDRVVLGSDWPFPMGATDPTGLVAHRGDDFVRRAAVDNARAALG